jgi:hypothetical protein
MRFSVRPPRLLAAVLATLAVALVACSGADAPTGPPALPAETLQAIELKGDWTWKQQKNRLELGVTHTQDSLDSEEPDEARQRGVDILSDSSAIWQNHHLMGFGTLNPEPAPGEYNWDSLDKRMQLTEDTNGRTVLTLCCSPDWMKGGAPGETDWSRLEEAPNPENFDDFAALSAAAVLRYPQIERVLVWNELKGFYNSEENRWDYEGYTELYNKVYTAVKAVAPDVQIGGPYAVLTSLDPGSPDSSDVSGPWGVADQRALDIIDYWLANNVGADFLAVDGATQTRQGTIATPADVGAQKYADLTRWIRDRSRLAVWWAEFYPDVPAGEQGGGRGLRGVGRLDRAAVGSAGAQPGVRGALDRQHGGRRWAADAAHRGLAVAGPAARQGRHRDRSLADAPAARVPGARRRARRQPDGPAGRGRTRYRAAPGLGRHADRS